MLACRPFFTADKVADYCRPDHPQAAGRGGIKCPEGLASIVAANGMKLVDTVTDGNCGLDAFLKSALQLPSLRNLRKEPWCKFRKMTKPEGLMQARRIAADWLQAHEAEEMWDGFNVGDLVRAMSGESSCNNYLDRMRKPGQWVDTAFLHALACQCGVDVVIFQSGTDTTLLGKSLTGQQCDVLVPIALSNDLHFWALEQDCSDDHVTHVDKGEFIGQAAAEQPSQADVDAEPSNTPTNQPTTQPTNQPNKPPTTNQPTNQTTTNQPTDRPPNQPPSWQCQKALSN